jgi:excisionase family DNA binding protein
MDKVLLTPEEAAKALSIGRTKVYELLQRRVLHSVQIGKSRRIPMTSIHELVDALGQGATVDDLDPPSARERVGSR